MSQVDWKTFNYWDPQHYVVFKVTGSAEVCLSTFQQEQDKYPTMQYATTICEKKLDESDNCYVVIKRFKTKELLRIHHEFPATYKREGKIL